MAWAARSPSQPWRGSCPALHYIAGCTRTTSRQRSLRRRQRELAPLRSGSTQACAPARTRCHAIQVHRCRRPPDRSSRADNYTRMHRVCCRAAQAELGLAGLLHRLLAFCTPDSRCSRERRRPSAGGNTPVVGTRACISGSNGSRAQQPACGRNCLPVRVDEERRNRRTPRPRQRKCSIGIRSTWWPYCRHWRLCHASACFQGKPEAIGPERRGQFSRVVHTANGSGAGQALQPSMESVCQQVEYGQWHIGKRQGSGRYQRVAQRE